MNLFETVHVQLRQKIKISVKEIEIFFFNFPQAGVVGKNFIAD